MSCSASSPARKSTIMVVDPCMGFSISVSCCPTMVSFPRAGNGLQLHELPVAQADTNGMWPQSQQSWGSQACMRQEKESNLILRFKHLHDICMLW